MGSVSETFLPGRESAWGEIANVEVCSFRVFNATLEIESSVIKWTVSYAGQIMSPAHRYDADEGTAYVLRRDEPKRETCQFSVKRSQP